MHGLVTVFPRRLVLKLRDFIPDEDREVINTSDGSLSLNGDLYVRLLWTSNGTANQSYQVYFGVIF
ncbi:hypothetical protein V1527DRAFT_474831 [Lipomyces starkeyi]